MIGNMQWIRTAPLVTREQYRARMAEQEWGVGPQPTSRAASQWVQPLPLGAHIFLIAPGWELIL